MRNDKFPSDKSAEECLKKLYSKFKSDFYENKKTGIQAIFSDHKDRYQIVVDLYIRGLQEPFCLKCKEHGEEQKKASVYNGSPG